jgi:hypothetical protein
MEFLVFGKSDIEQRPFGMLFALEASSEETKRDANGVLYIETLDCGTTKTSNTQ